MYYILLLGILIAGLSADTPASCTYDEIAGDWILYEGSRSLNSNINCTDFGSPVSRIRVQLRYPNVAIDEYGNRGEWTVIYNQGFQVTVNQRTFFAFSFYNRSDGDIISYCGLTFPSWSHDVTLRHWACFYGRKKVEVPAKVHQDPFFNWTKGSEVLTSSNVHQLVESINNAQTSWRATAYDKFVGKTHEDLLKMRGGKRSWVAQRPRAAPSTDSLKAQVSALPPSFDWRNISGMNFVSPVRDQGLCGSCYAFSSMGMLEARIRVQTNNTLKLQLSPQDVLSCSQISQGCDGGFSILVAGKYAKEYGAVEESCSPYTGRPGVCKRKSCLKHYAVHYGYVGGYYGACNEESMMLELINGGPMSVAMEAYPDFQFYSGGIYHHTGLGNFNPLEIVNHAVLLVGYGVEEKTGEKFWIVKNSWDTDWGENGFFRIRRGNDEVGIESSAIHVTPIP